MAWNSRRSRNLLDPLGWPTQNQPPEDAGYPPPRPTTRPQNDTGGNDWFTLSKPVGPDGTNDNADVAKVESLLGHAGAFDIKDGPTGWYGTRTRDAVKDFQKQNGLEVDGLLNPSGPTITALKRQVGNAFSGFTPPTRDQIEAHHVDLKQGGNGLLTFGPTRVNLKPIADLPELSGEEYSANGRTLDSLRRYSTDGEMPRWIAADIADRGTNGVARARDLVERMKASDPQRGEGLAGAIYDALNGPHKGAFTGGDMPTKPPAGVLAAEAYPTMSLNEQKPVAKTPAPAPEPTQPSEQKPKPPAQTPEPPLQSQATPQSTPAPQIGKPPMPQPSPEPAPIGNPSGNQQGAQRKQPIDASENPKDFYQKHDFDPDKTPGEYMAALKRPIDARKADNLHDEAVDRTKDAIKKGTLPPGIKAGMLQTTPVRDPFPERLTYQPKAGYFNR